MKAVSENLLSEGSKVTVYLSATGALQLFIDDNYIGACVINIPLDKQLWLVVDVYGNTAVAKFVKPGKNYPHVFI